MAITTALEIIRSFYRSFFKTINANVVRKTKLMEMMTQKAGEHFLDVAIKGIFLPLFLLADYSVI